MGTERYMVFTPVVNVLCIAALSVAYEEFRDQKPVRSFEPSRFFALRMTETIVTSNSVTSHNREMTDIKWSISPLGRSGPVSHRSTRRL